MKPKKMKRKKWLKYIYRKIENNLVTQKSPSIYKSFVDDIDYNVLRNY